MGLTGVSEDNSRVQYHLQSQYAGFDQRLEYVPLLLSCAVARSALVHKSMTAGSLV